MDSSRANTPSRVENKPDTIRLRWCITTSVWTRPLFCQRSTGTSGDDREVANADRRPTCLTRADTFPPRTECRFERTIEHLNPYTTILRARRVRLWRAIPDRAASRLFG